MLFRFYLNYFNLTGLNIHLCSLSFFKITAIIIGTNVLIIKFKNSFNTKFLPPPDQILRLADSEEGMHCNYIRDYTYRKNQTTNFRCNARILVQSKYKMLNQQMYMPLIFIDNLSIIQILQLPTATKSDVIRIALSTVTVFSIGFVRFAIQAPK